MFKIRHLVVGISNFVMVGFCVGRVTEISEEDTFLCESKVQEADRTVKRLGKGLKVREKERKLT